ncbi:MAG: hypothetical protein F6K16_37590 [Symploca sp. SIO2B6]|nr:hypothetical protein [Symploca sp. SIO2B6]
MNICPCCSERLLRHSRQNKVYWFCIHCHQEMPNLSSTIKINQVYPKLTPHQADLSLELVH